MRNQTSEGELNGSFDFYIMTFDQDYSKNNLHYLPWFSIAFYCQTCGDILKELERGDLKVSIGYHNVMTISSIDSDV